MSGVSPYQGGSFVPHRMEQPRWEFGLVCLVIFIFNLHVSFSSLFPVLRPLRPQLVIGALTVIGFLVSSASSRKIAIWSAAQTWYALYLLIAVISLMQTAAVGVLDIGLESVATIAKQFALLSVIVGYSSTALGFRRVWLGFVVAVSAFELHSLKAIVSGHALVEGRLDSYVGLVGNSDYLGLFFVMFAFITAELARGAEPWSRRRKIYISLGLGCCLIAVMTQTRAAFLALVLVGVLWLWRCNNRALAFKVLAAVVVIMTVVSLTVRTPQGTYFERVQTIWAGQEHEDFNQKSRRFLWNEGLRLWGMFPLLGCGTGATGPHMNLMMDDMLLGDARKGFSLHQTFLQVAAERGTLGLVTFLGFLYVTFRSLNTARRAVEGTAIERDWLPTLNGLQYALWAYLIGAFFMSIENEWAVIIFAGLGTGAGIAVRAEIAAFQKPDSSLWKGWKPVTL
jgi:O-antigen ligase